MNKAFNVTRIGLLVIAIISFDSATGLSVTLKKATPQVVPKASEQINVTGKYVVYVEGNMEFNNNVADIEKAFKKRDWEATKDNPAFRKFVRARYGTEVEKLKTYAKATFWEDLMAFLDEVKANEKKYQKVTSGIVSEELKAVVPKINKARNDFNYAEVNRLLQEFEKKYPGAEQDAAKGCYLKAQYYELQINYAEAERYYKKAADLGDKDPFYLNAYALILQTVGKYLEAEPIFRQALNIRETTLESNHPDVALSQNDLAYLLYDRRKYSEADSLYRRALAIREKALGRDHPDVANSLNNLAGLLETQGQYEEAKPLYRRALAIRETTLDANHPDVALSLNNLAALLYNQCQYAEAEPLFCRAREIREKALGPDDPDVANSLWWLAHRQSNQGKYVEAKPHYSQALAVYEKALGRNHPTTIQCRDQLDDLLKIMQ